MGLSSQAIRVILNDHKYKPITGSVLLIGRQTVYLTPEEAIKLIQEEGLPIRPGAQAEVDKTTRSSSTGGFISDASLFSLFTDAKVQALDVSDYEGAEIVCNLNEPLRETLVGQFDFIYNGSCLDNIFDPATSIKNLSRLLNSSGRIVHVEHGSSFNGPYLMYPPDWFYDYYAVNQFSDCKVYVALFNGGLIESGWDAYSWDPVVYLKDKKEPSLHYETSSSIKIDSVIITVAEKGSESTSSNAPVQFQYRSSEEQNSIVEASLRFSRSLRPKIHPLSGENTSPKYSIHRPRSRRWAKFQVNALIKKTLGQEFAFFSTQNDLPPSFKFCRTLT